MKLLFCENCSSVFSLSFRVKTCDCGLTRGVYVNRLRAVYNGPGIPLGFANPSLNKSLNDLGTDFTAFTIRKDSKTFEVTEFKLVNELPTITKDDLLQSEVN